MRGDMETLGYNLVHWCTTSLPWIGQSEQRAIVRSKSNLIANPDLIYNLYSNQYLGTESKNPNSCYFGNVILHNAYSSLIYIDCFTFIFILLFDSVNEIR